MASGSCGAPAETIRLCEWGRLRVPEIPDDARHALADAAAGWRAENRLPALPLEFGGPDGRTLQARQYVGVVEAAGWTVEIYPKLDAGLLGKDILTAKEQAGSVLHDLLWLLDASGHGEIVDADTAALEEIPSRFLDLFAYLYAKQLRRALHTHGIARRYEIQQEDLPGIRGRIRITHQITRHWNRMDKLACAWDEFTSDTPINRLLRCACRHLGPRVRHAEAARLLSDCALLLDDVQDIPPAAALRETMHTPHFGRGAWERYRRPFLLARRLLRGFGHHLGAGSADTFVFLIDMNQVFEAYARAVLEARFSTRVEEQKQIGRLLALKAGGILQKADFFWRTETGTWIGDAKYKHLARNGQDALHFENLPLAEEGESEDAPTAMRAVQVLSPDDVRQLTVYAELHRRQEGGDPPHLALLYPFVGAGRFAADSARAWNGSALSLVPLRVTRQPCLADALPPEFGESSPRLKEIPAGGRT